MNARRLVLAGALLLTAAPAAAQLHDAADESLVAADGTPFFVTRGFVRVPERRPWRDGEPTIDLAVVRIRPSSPRRPGATHVLLAGGPGDSGVRIALGLARQGGAVASDLLKSEIVGIDQRGTGASRPSLAVTAPYGLPLDQPGSPASWLPAMEAATRRAAAELRARGIRLEAYTTRESADDVDDVRRALGVDRVVLWGRSYGSHLALAALRQHPSSVDRVVLVGPEGPDHTWKRPALVDAVLARIASRAGRPELPDDIRRIVDRLREAPVRVTAADPATGQPVVVGIGPFDVQWIIAQAIGDPRMLASLPAAVRAMAGGDFTGIARIIAARRSRLGLVSALPQVVNLASGATASRLAAIEREGRAAVLGSAIDFPGPELAAAWAVGDSGDGFRQPLVSDVPVLILAGDLDARTPLENGEELAATLSGARLVVVENAAHQFDVFGSAPIRAVLAAFLEGRPPTAARVSLPPIPFAP